MSRLLLLTCLMAAALPALADENGPARTAGEKSGKNSAAEERQPAFTPEREAAALSFVSQHHSELEDLLAQLKSGNRREYQRAINELFTTSERLASIKERDPLRYELDLQAWKIDSRIRLLAARLAMTDNALLQGELKELLLEKLDVQLEQQLLERQRISARLEKVDAAIQRIRTQREDEASKALAKVLAEVQKNRPVKKPARSGSNATPPKAK